jgi:hypothetical protein
LQLGLWLRICLILLQTGTLFLSLAKVAIG